MSFLQKMLAKWLVGALLQGEAKQLIHEQIKQEVATETKKQVDKIISGI